MSSLAQYSEKSFQDVMRGDLALPERDTKEDDSDDAEEADQDEAKATSVLTERIKTVLGERVEEVRPSERLTDSPACLVLGEFAMGAQMQRIMEASGQAMPQAKPIFEYNVEHPLVVRLDNETDEDRFHDLLLILFDQASLAEGTALTNASEYVTRLNRLLLSLLSD